MRYGCNVNEDNASMRRFNLHETLHPCIVWDLKPLSLIIPRGFGLLLLSYQQLNQSSFLLWLNMLFDITVFGSNTIKYFVLVKIFGMFVKS